MSPELILCDNCQTESSNIVRLCPTCGEDLGYPNVRIAISEGKILNKKYSDKISNLEKTSKKKLDLLINKLENESRVVIAIPVNQAKVFLDDSKGLYTNYEKQVNAGVRTGASTKNDTTRCAVSGKFFGSYADDIIYGVLSLNNESLKNYGDVFLTLKNVAIQKRVSFLIENTYHFVEKNNCKIHEPLPQGYRAHWGNRNKLVIIKHYDSLEPDFDITKCSIHLVLQGQNRDNDSCIEAHIYGTFNTQSIETIKFSSNIKRKDKLLIENLVKGNTIKVI